MAIQAKGLGNNRNYVVAAEDGKVYEVKFVRGEPTFIDTGSKYSGVNLSTTKQNIVERVLGTGIKDHTTVIILEGKPTEADISEEIKSEVANLTKDLSGVYGLYVVDLFSGSALGINEDEMFQAASLIKLPVMAMFYEQVEKRRSSLTDTYVLSEGDKVGGSGSLYYEPAGTVKTYDELLMLMGKQSDNTAFNVLVKELGEDELS